MNDLLKPISPKLSRRHFLKITAAAGALILGSELLKHPLKTQLSTLHDTRTLMGTVINLALVTDDPDHGRSVIEATFGEMQRLIACFDHRQPANPVALLNRHGQLSGASPELVEIITRALYYSELTDGAFDISVKPLLDVYSSGEIDVQSSRSLVDYRNIKIDGDLITFQQPGMSITLDGIAKGRVVDAAAASLKASGFDRILVEAGGDLVGHGLRADEQQWQVGLANPRQNNGPQILTTLPVANQAIATSGDYMNSFTNDFKLHHIIDPRTGISPTELSSVTVIAPTATEADALSTALMVLGSTAGLALLNRLPQVEALVVSKEMQLHYTSGFPIKV